MTNKPLLEPPVGRRERRKRATREALIENALRLFAAKGYESTTIAEITDAVDVSASTFFGYFASKEDVVFAAYEEEIAELAAALEKRPAGETTVAAIAARVAATGDASPRTNELQALRTRVITRSRELREAQRRRITVLLEASLCRCYADDLGEDPASVGPKVLAAMTAAGLCAVSTDFFTHLADGDPMTKEALLAEFATVRSSIDGAFEALRPRPAP
jgi:AcrR family transcriptional regulator